MTSSATSGKTYDEVFFKKAAVVWQILRANKQGGGGGGKSTIEVMQMMDPEMDKKEANKYKMKVSRWAKRLDIDQLLLMAEEAGNTTTSGTTGSDRGAGATTMTIPNVPATPSDSSDPVLPSPCMAVHSPTHLSLPPIQMTNTLAPPPPPPPARFHNMPQHLTPNPMVGEFPVATTTQVAHGMATVGDTVPATSIPAGASESHIMSPLLVPPPPPPPPPVLLPTTTAAAARSTVVAPPPSTEANQSAGSESSSIRFSHGKTRWAELNRSLKHVERVLRADGYKVTRRTKNQMAADRCNQERDEAQFRAWSDEYVTRFQQATMDLVEARKKDPLNASARLICNRIASETEGRILLSEKSVRRAVRNGRAGQRPRKAGKPITTTPPPPSSSSLPTTTPIEEEEEEQQLFNTHHEEVVVEEERKSENEVTLEHDALSLDLLSNIGPPGMTGTEFVGVPTHHHHHHHDPHPLEEQKKDDDEDDDEDNMEDHDPCFIPLCMTGGMAEGGVFDGETFTNGGAHHNINMEKDSRDME